jgi:hypothetical protein
MKNIPEGLRIAAPLLAVVLGCFAIDTLVAEALTPRAQPFSQDLLLANPTSSGSLADWAAAVALRGDLLADIAMARAAPALSRGQAADPAERAAARERALATARQSLALAPHSSGTWLLAAMLESPAEASGAAVLKMSYLTSPADMSLIPGRLAIVAASAAIADGELRGLARGDIRLILTRRPDLKPAIAGAYRDGSADGKAYIDEVLQSLDPGFAATLR